MQRLLTAAIAVPLALAAILWLPPALFFLFILVLVGAAAVEYVQLFRPSLPAAPLWLVLALMPPVAVAAYWCLLPQGAPLPEGVLLAGGLLLTVGTGTLVVISGAPPAEATSALGLITFGIPYFALPVATIGILQAIDPWLLLLGCAIVWSGDTAAFYVGSSMGRHKMAPVISPNKTWEGAVAGLVAGVLAAVVWAWLRLGEIDLGLLAVAAATGVAAQVGDLTESLFKRGMQVKDSGSLLPGHGGFLDRMDAALFAAPVLLAGVWMLGLDGVGL